MLEPERLVLTNQMKPAPLPPLTEKLTPPRGADDAEPGEMERPAETATLFDAVLPSESVARTTSVTPPIAPAVYTPLEFMPPPEALVDSHQPTPAPLPPP